MRQITYFSMLFFFFASNVAFGQVTDNFTDGDFTQSPTWNGATGNFIVNAAKELQLNSLAADTSILSTPHLLANFTGNKEWRIHVRQTFAPSSSNYGRVYLTADNSDLTLVQNGYYLQFGETGSTDAIRLFKLASGVSTQICAGVNGQIAASFNANVKVIRTNAGLWSLFADLAGGSNFILQGTGNDVSTLIGTHFGVSCTYTMSNATKFYYDEVYIGNEILDLIPPALSAVSVISANQLDILYNESVTMASAQNLASYGITPTVNISSLTLDPINTALVHAVLATNLTNGTSYVLNTTNVSDLNNNISGPLTGNFQYLVSDSAVVGDLIINEFFPDPSPVIGLPDVEFVEVHNVSNKIFNLSGFKITDGSSSGVISSGWILPGEYKVLTATASIPLFLNTSAIGVTSFPSLNNAGDSVKLMDNANHLLDLVVYTDDWYNDAVKMDGGYTLELINPNDPCSDVNNWTASNDVLGGTPGFVNSVNDLSPDTLAPGINMLQALAPNFLQIWFSEGMDSSSLVNASYQFSPNLTPSLIYTQSQYSNTVILQFVENLIPSQIYSVTITNAADCWINSQSITANFALTEIPLAGEIVINEILQNPYNNGSDWIELYNTSNKMFDLKDLIFANFDNDTIANFKVIPQHYLLKPGGYAVLGDDSLFAKQAYPTHADGTFVFTYLPAYNNDSGSVYLFNNSQLLLDLVKYNNEWQFPLLDDVDGVSLERLDPLGPSSDGKNWHSAAEAVKFGTPGLKNSQYSPVTVNGAFELQNEVFSPDMDGNVDVMQASYQMAQANCLGTVTIFDERGRIIRSLFKNQLLGTEGTLTWDGVKDDQTKASIGVYVVLFEAFTLDGGLLFAKRKAVTLAGKI